MITVKFFTLLRLQLGVEALEIDADDIEAGELLHRVCSELGSDLVAQKLLDTDGSLRTGTIVLINGHDILDLDKLATVVHRGDAVSLFTPGGGG
jgi:molybdopterin synthase sulfur carrier subunit